MGKKQKNRRPNGPPWGRRGTQPPPQPSNTYTVLDVGSEINGQYNAHLTERISTTVARNPDILGSYIPESGPVRVNDDIRRYYEIASKPVAGAGPWLEMPEVPHASEILHVEHASNTIETLITIEDEPQPQPRPKRIEGPYDSTEDYLRTEYELLREDALRPLREAVTEVRKDPWRDEAKYEKGVGIYEPVYITSLVFSPRGLATRVAFSLSRVKKYIRWEQSKRLITGTLVALSPYNDAFQTTCVLATVAARPISQLKSNPPEIDLFFPHYNQPFDPMQKWLMVECRSSFFEASRHTLIALQHMMREPFPLSDYLVQARQDVEPPPHIRNNPYLDLSALVSMEEASSFQNVNALEEWPEHGSTLLDKSQSKAVKRILTRKVAIVQGPPGTGKTFVSVKATQVLCDNMHKGDAPIIITAQTNHAVDQMLRHTSSFEPDFIRLGGRSKDPEIKKRALFEVRSALPMNKRPHGPKTQGITGMKKARAACQKLLAPLELGIGPLDHELLQQMGLLTREQAGSLEMDHDSILDMPINKTPGEAIQQWIGKGLVECRRPAGPDDFGCEWEEEDLEIEQLQELEAEATTPDDDDIEALKGEVMMLSDNYRGKSGGALNDRDIQQLLDTTKDLTEIDYAKRGCIYNYLMRMMKKKLLTQLREVAKDYHNAFQLRRVGLWEEDVNLLRKQRIIGMTTTGLSKYRPLIAALQPRVILVEEAAETMEAPVTVACLPTVEHLILVGDHQQLRPHTQVKKFEDAPFHLNLSLFERLVINGIEFDQLNKQRRMISEIRRLLLPIYGDTLKDHPSVKDPSNRPPVKGMGGVDSYYFTHTWPEGRDANSSCFNDAEAEFIAKFADYLVLNGEAPSGITILTFYNGQRKRLLQHLRHEPNLAQYAFKVVTVDSYQGEENDIVILSLVRSNKNHSIGFLSNVNRACVALSRAKRGFYLFGNAELLACESWTWAEVVDIMYHTKVPITRSETCKERRIGYFLPVKCTEHGRKSWVEFIDDWDEIHGGCDYKCSGVLPCSHKCPYRCHPFAHDVINCKMVCSKDLPCGHRCHEECSRPCRCQACDRRTGGQRSMLKIGAHQSRQQPSTPPRLLLDIDFQAPANPPPAAGLSEKWEAYVNGGAKADDARLLQKRRDQNTGFEEARCNGAVQSATPTSAGGVTSDTGKLIDTSPKKPRASLSPSTSLLVDLGLSDHTYQSHASTAESGKTKAARCKINLLD